VGRSWLVGVFGLASLPFYWEVRRQLSSHAFLSARFVSAGPVLLLVSLTASLRQLFILVVGEEVVQQVAPLTVGSFDSAPTERLQWSGVD
jgi:hypothetical protein